MELLQTQMRTPHPNLVEEVFSWTYTKGQGTVAKFQLANDIGLTAPCPKLRGSLRDWTRGGLGSLNMSLWKTRILAGGA